MSDYILTVGMEVHVELKTNTKMFCGCVNNADEKRPNANICPVCMAHPGVLPVPNKEAIRSVLRVGAAIGAELADYSEFDRKSYFYPDLPKGYQLSQYEYPFVKGGTVGGVAITRIHLEEDTARSQHDPKTQKTLIDYNRAGVPLMELVTEPVIHSGEQAAAFAKELQILLRTLGVSHANMEKGEMRVEANISVSKDPHKLGTKVEVKNLNSIRNVKKAIEYEIERMIDIVERGDAVQQQTRSFDADTDTTFALREKEEANDYRYFPEPDLPPVILSDEYLDEIKRSMPALPAALSVKMKDEYGLNENDASQICAEKETAEYFLALIKHTNDYKAAANWLNGPLRQYANENKILINDIKISAEEIAGIIEMIEKGMINFSAAAQKLFPALLNNPGKLSPQQMAESLNMLQVNDTAELEQWIDTVLAAMPAKVAEYKKGKKGLIGLFMGEVKKLSKGKADPKATTAMLEEKLR